MKNIFQFKALMALLTILVLAGCGQQSKEHIEEADENLTEASENLKDAAKDADDEVKAKATADWQAFKDDSDRSIAAMEKQAKELRAKIAKADKKTKANIGNDLDKLTQKLNDQKTKLNQKNAEIQNSLSNFDESVAIENEQFQKEFTHDLTGLSTAFNDLFEDNIK